MRKILLVFKLVYILRFAQISDYIKYVFDGRKGPNAQKLSSFGASAAALVSKSRQSLETF